MALEDTQARELPLRVRWTCTARATRDSNGPVLGHHGFEVGAGYFFELAVRREARSVAAAREMGSALWLSLQVRADGGVHGLIRRTNEDHDPGVDLDARQGTPGLAILGRFALRARDLDPSRPFVVELAITPDEWTLSLQQGAPPASESSGTWGAGGAPWAAPLAGALYVWGHHGEWAEGRGSGSVLTEVSSLH